MVALSLLCGGDYAIKGAEHVGSRQAVKLLQHLLQGRQVCYFDLIAACRSQEHMKHVHYPPRHSQEYVLGSREPSACLVTMQPQVQIGTLKQDVVQHGETDISLIVWPAIHGSYLCGSTPHHTTPH